MMKQDPTFTAKMSEETGQTIISGMGELHLEIISKRMERDFHLKFRTHKPRVTYRETVPAKYEAEGRFDRATGGTRQFAAVRIVVEPVPNEATLNVENKLKPNALPPELLDVLLNALRDELKGGGIVGYPLINMKVVLKDIDYREGETTEVALRAASSDAMRHALQDGGATLLEPIMKLEVVTPEDFLGNITADLNSRRAIIVNTELRGNLVALTAEAALSQMFGYSNDVRSLSQGRASFSMEPLRYDVAVDPPEM
jgi:elongation factor G